MSSQSDAQKLADDLQSLVKDAEALLRAAGESAEGLTDDARERADRTLKALRGKLSSLERELKGRAEVVDGYVRENPWKTVAIVGGVALLVGIVLGRR